jgi:RNA polymerase nonessential primary-like sigma factor
MRRFALLFWAAIANSIRDGGRNVGKLLNRNNTDSDCMRAYLNEIGKIPLLSADEEINLGRIIQAWMNRSAGLDEAEKLTVEEKREKRAFIQARKKMVDANLRLVVSVAKRYQNRDVPILDLIQEGSLGLQRAAEKFDPAKGWRFSTYAHWWIRQGITRCIAEQGRSIRLPVHVVEKISKINRYVNDFRSRQGRSPSIKEIAEFMDLTPSQIHQILADQRPIISLNRKQHIDADAELIETIHAPAPPLEEDEQPEMRARIAKLSQCLTPTEQQVIRLRFGIETGDGMTIKQIGEALQITESQAKVLNQRAMRKLRYRAKRYAS